MRLQHERKTITVAAGTGTIVVPVPSGFSRLVGFGVVRNGLNTAVTVSADVGGDNEKLNIINLAAASTDVPIKEVREAALKADGTADAATVNPLCFGRLTITVTGANGDVTVNLLMELVGK